MTKLDSQQSNHPQEFGNQRLVTNQLYQIALKNDHTRKELERYWESLARDDLATDQTPNN